MSDICKNWTQWLSETRFSHMDEIQKEQTFRWLFALRDVVISNAGIKNNDKIIDIGCGTGLLSFGVLEKFQDNVELIFSDKFEDCLVECEKILKESNIKNRASFLQSDCLDIKLPDNAVNVALTRSVLVHIADKQKTISMIVISLLGGYFNILFVPNIDISLLFGYIIFLNILSL